MFNHKRTPNVAWERDIPLQSIRYFALRDIAEGEELCISYGPKLWFKDVDGAEEEYVVNEEEALSCDVDVFS
jgi:SET domain-containing protein